MMKNILAIVCALSLAVASSAQTRIKPSDLTLEEKISLLSCNMGIERLGVPVSFYSEAMHGIAYGGPSNWGAYKPLPTTSFPQAYGLGETWDQDLLRRVGEWISIEQRYYFQNPAYDRAGLIMWGPNVDLGRDPRWGRSEECYGEDPWLISELAIGYISGAHGPDPDHWRSSPMMKHFMANSYEIGRHTTSSDFSERLMREYYAYTFWRCVKEADCKSFMTSYNPVNGIPMTVHPAIREMAIDEWGMDGPICTDEESLRRLWDEYGWYADDHAEGAAACIKAGITQFLEAENHDYEACIREAIARGLVTEAEIDEAIQRNLNVMEKLGLLGGDDPYASIGRDGAPVPCTTPEASALCREATDKSIVLLKNDGLLPLDPSKLKKVALIGPYIDVVMQDWYGGNTPYQVSILNGLKAALGPDVEILTEKQDFGGAAMRIAAEADVAIVVVGNRPSPCLDFERKNPELGWGKSYVISDGMEQIDRQSLTLAQEDIVKSVFKANPNTVMLLTTTFPYAIGWSKENVPAILQMTNSSMEMGNAAADVLLGRYNPAGRLTQTWPESVLDLPPIYDYDITKGRTYMYARSEPLFPFGFGLSYSTFKYSSLKVRKVDDGFVLTVDVTNKSALDGDEVVQVYAQYPHSKVLRPERQLRGFRRVNIPAGQTVTVEIPVALEDLAYWDEAGHGFVVEPGRVRFLVGASSSDIRAKARVRIASR